MSEPAGFRASSAPAGLSATRLPSRAWTRKPRFAAFVDEHAPDGRYPADWSRRLAAAGYVVPHWPRPWGLDATPAEQLAIDEVLRELRSPRPMNPIGIGWAGPTLLVAGTDAQQQRWLPGILDGSDLWCQLFSEPGAGSDLASLQTRAVRDGDEYVVNGQKVWTTLAHVARYGILLARTNPDAEDHHGITYFVVDMRSPGIEVRPLVQMTGTHEFNEVFFTDVRIPAANVVGAVDDGWRLAKVTLGNERVSLSGEGALWGRGPTAQDVIALVRGARRDARSRPAPAARRALLRSRGAAPDPAAHGVGARARARARSGGIGAQGALGRARPARHGGGQGARGHLRAVRRTSVRSASPIRKVGTTATSTPAHSRSAAVRARCNATSSGRRCSASLAIPREGAARIAGLARRRPRGPAGP